MSALPLDLIIEILYRLPVKSLLRFRCLSKQFRCIIDGPEFINRHLLRKRFSLDQTVIVQGGKHPYLLSLHLDSLNNNACKLDLPFDNWGADFYVIGGCDGLLALSHYRLMQVGLWNISTRKHQILPKFWSDCNRDDEIYDGFGYDVATDDYKWVRIIDFPRTNVTEVSVYSLKANSSRRVNGFPPYTNYYLRGVAAFVKGTLNWVVEVGDGGGDLIVSFDLKTEKFFEMSFPDATGEAKPDSEWGVMVFGEWLCLSYIHPNELAFDIWVMKELGVKKSWTKLFSFSHQIESVLFSPVTQSVVYSNRGDKVFVFQDNGEAYVYDLGKKRGEIVEINNGWLKEITYVIIYVDSLVSPVVNM